jgi:hypothetical protein
MKPIRKADGYTLDGVKKYKRYFSLDDDCVEYTDIYFKKGFEKIYKTNSLAQRKQKAKEWENKKFGRIGSLMTLQIGH